MTGGLITVLSTNLLRLHGRKFVVDRAEVSLAVIPWNINHAVTKVEITDVVNVQQSPCPIASLSEMAAPRAKAISHESYHSEEELRVLRAIVAREEGLDLLLELCCNFEEDRSVEVLEMILNVRDLSLDVIDAVAGWRRRMVQQMPFQWRNVNYLLKMCSDLDFLSRSQLATAAMDGLRIARRNPFTTIGGLDQSMRVYWQRDLPEEDDLPVLLDSTSYGQNVRVDQPSKIRLAECFLLREEKQYGRLPKSDVLGDLRMKTLLQKEAENSSKSRFGGVRGDRIGSQREVTTRSSRPNESG